MYAIFCSKKCSDASYYERKKAGTLGLKLKSCKNCNQEFQQRKSTQFCCSKLCSSALYRRGMAPSKRRAYALRYTYGLTEQQWSDMFYKQGEKCAVCRLTLDVSETATDHDHATGKVRGILCRKCNLGLGYFDDDQEKLRFAAEYLAISSLELAEFYG